MRRLRGYVQHPLLIIVHNQESDNPLLTLRVCVCLCVCEQETSDHEEADEAEAEEEDYEMEAEDSSDESDSELDEKGTCVFSICGRGGGAVSVEVCLCH